MQPASKLFDLVKAGGKIGFVLSSPSVPPTWINNLPASKMTDPVKFPLFRGRITFGSTNTFISGLPAARMGDPVRVGSSTGRIISGSHNTFIGG